MNMGYRERGRSCLGATSTVRCSPINARMRFFRVAHQALNVEYAPAASQVCGGSTGQTPSIKCRKARTSPVGFTNCSPLDGCLQLMATTHRDAVRAPPQRYVLTAPFGMSLQSRSS